jgi:tRNA/tmRNA/rRNA uracil-C5-methylase (TrmA/RlmC/RlmD family)
VEVVHGRVEKALKKYVAANVVILDPPRSGAGVAVIDTVVALRPRAIVYVACDPASLARDTAYLKDRGFKLQKLRAFDLFPMTAHMECVARFIPE